MVSAAAPNVKQGESNDPRLVQEAITAIMIAPKNDGSSNRHIGARAWGCGAFGCDAHAMAQHFATALNQRLGEFLQRGGICDPRRGPERPDLRADAACCGRPVAGNETKTLTIDQVFWVLSGSDFLFLSGASSLQEMCLVSVLIVSPENYTVSLKGVKHDISSHLF